MTLEKAMSTVRKSGHPVLGVAQRVLETCNANPKSVAITPMQLLKLVYLCHGWTLGLLGRPLIDKPVEAWRYGPVIPELYHAIKHFGSEQVTEIKGAEKVTLAKDEQSIVEQVCDHYGGWSGLDLSRLTHQVGSPWSETYEPGCRGLVISNDLIEDHYKKLSAAQQ